MNDLRFRRTLPMHMNNGTPWEDELARRERQDFWASVIFVVGLVGLGIAIGWVLGKVL